MNADLLESIAFLRGFGFYGYLAGRSDAEVLALIQAGHGSGFEFLLAKARAKGLAAVDQLLVWQEGQRVWSRDLEGVYLGEEAYVQTLLEWAALSQGVFAPAEAVEHWDSPEGPVRLRFRVGGRCLEFVHPDGQDTFLKTWGLLQLVNSVLPQGWAFVVAEDFSADPNHVLCLSAPQCQTLQRRGWSLRLV